MTVRTFVIGCVVTAAVAAVIWLLIVFFLDPIQAGFAGYTLFFLSLFLLIASVAALLGFGVRRLLHVQQLASYSVRGSLRQGVFLGLFFCALLLLIRVRLYQWWVAVILTILLVMCELIFISYDKAHSRYPQKTLR